MIRIFAYNLSSVSAVSFYEGEVIVWKRQGAVRGRNDVRQAYTTSGQRDGIYRQVTSSPRHDIHVLNQRKAPADWSEHYCRILHTNLSTIL